LKKRQKKKIQDKLNKTNKQDKRHIKPPAGLTKDAFSNAMARIGYNTSNLLEATEYPITRLTKDYALMNSLYRSNWIVRKIIDTIPEDMCKNWINIITELEPDQLRQIQRLERITKLKSKILQGLKWGRLYGGAGGLIIIDGHEDILDEPLNYDDIMPDSFKGLFITDRWSGITPGQELITDINDPEFGLPLNYEITTEDGQVLRVDHTRIVRFIGRKLPYWEELAEMHWGESEVELVFEELKKRDNTSYNIATLVFLANLKVLKVGDLREMLSVGNDKAAKRVYNTIQSQNQLLSNMGMLLLNKEDDFQTFQYSFSGLNDIYQSFMLDVAGACEIPVTRLFGRSPAGMDATGEGDMQNYYDTVEEKQETHLTPVFDKLLPILCMSEFGAIPDDLDYRYNPIRTPNESEVADLVDKKSTSINNLYQSGLINQKIALKELRQMSDSTGMFSNISDDDIENADDFTSEGELEDLKNYGSENSQGPVEAEEENRKAIPENIKTGDEDTPRKFKWFKKS
jgi:hypothetical protein